MDLDAHLTQLMKRNIVDSGWNPYPKPEISEGMDFVSDLLTKYVDDLMMRKKLGESEESPASVHLRKVVMLEEIDDIISVVQAKSEVLYEEAQKNAERLAEE